MSFGGAHFANNPEYQNIISQEKPLFDNENLVRYWEPQILQRPSKMDYLAVESHQEMMNTQNTSKSQ